MSLLKRLLLTVSVAILIILSGTLALSIHAARQYLDGQLLSQSENAAAALALSLSQPGNQDEVSRELLMMALFDSGQFRAIRLLGTDGQTLFERHQPANMDTGAAPAWFARLLPLRTPEAQRSISDGWKQIGNLSVTVDSSFARDALWLSSIRLSGWVLLAGVFWALSVVGLLHWFRRVLQEEVSSQVRGIGSSAVVQTPTHSRVAELTTLVHAISDTRERVQATSLEQSVRIESLELEVNRDPVTLLPNRKYFMNALRRLLEGHPDSHEPAAPAGGHVLLFRQRDLQALNQRLSRALADEWLASIAARIQATLAVNGAENALLARLNGSDFVVLMPGMEGPAAMLVVQQIKRDLQALRQPTDAGHWCRWAYALADYGRGARVSELMSRLDQALMRSESVGQDEVEYLTDSGPRDGVGESEWKQVLTHALAQDRVSLHVTARRYAAGSDRSERNEGSLVLQDQHDQSLQGALFLPVAVRLGLSSAFDLRAVQLAQRHLRIHPSLMLTVKVSLPSLADPNFLPQLRVLWQSDLDSAQRLWMELDAHGLVAYAAELQALAQAAEASRVRLGLRRLEHEPMALARLHEQPLSYVKLGADFAQQTASSPGSHYLLRAMLETARTLQLQVYLDGSVDGASRVALQEMGVYIAEAEGAAAA